MWLVWNLRPFPAGQANQHWPWWCILYHGNRYWNNPPWTGHQWEHYLCYIANVLYAEHMATTLLSVSDLTKCNHTLLFDNDDCNIRSKTTGALVGIASQWGPSDLYWLLAHVTHKHVSANTAMTHLIDINMLHQWLGHLVFDNIWWLVNQGMVEDISKLTGTPEFCQPCALGKGHQLPLPNNKATVSNILV